MALRCFHPAWLILLGAFCSAKGSDATDAARPGVVTFPVPPAQATPWTPPATKLSPVAVDAITTIFKQGLPDPRDCDYREIEIGVPEEGEFDFRVPKGTTKTHGWVLPQTGAQKFAICWNGVIYPITAVSGPADLRADVENELKKDQAEEASWKKTAGGWKPGPDGGLPHEDRGNSDPAWRNSAVDGFELLHAALLLRLGHSELAAAVYDQWYWMNEMKDSLDPYLDLTDEWIGALYLEALHAHQRGDDGLGRAILQTVTDLRPSLEAEAVRRRLQKPPDYFHSGAPRITYFPYLVDLPVFLADEQRRCAEAPFVPVAQMNPSPSGPQRVTLLIRDLELLYAPPAQWGFLTPGFNRAFLVKELVKEGEPAIGPLLDCLENDRRLTRANSIDQPLEVDAVAYEALCQILHIPQSGNRPQQISPIARQSFIDQVRAHMSAK